MEIYIFGASIGGKHVYDILTNLGVKIIGFIDNNEKKWGTVYQHTMVYAPNKLLHLSDNQKIIIASTYHDEIRSQLLHMQISEDKIVIKEQIICNVLGLKNGAVSGVQHIDNRIIFDLTEGFILSGVVNWSINLIEQLYLDNQDVYVLAMRNEDCNYNFRKIEDRIHWIDYNLARYKQSINESISFIESKLPCKIIVNQITQIFWAASMIKQAYPDDIEIVSVIHSDFSRIYEQNVFLDKYIDQYLCVSKDIQKKLKYQYGVAEKKLHYKATSVEYNTEFYINDRENNKKIRLAYAARLEKAQKRTDLLIPLIKVLKNKRIDFQLNVAGDGTYYKKLEEYIQEQNLEGQVKLFGALSYDDMKDFWEENDIFINLSDIEGMPVSLLEAMSWGVVPIVTETSGVSAVVQNGVNGFICRKEDIETISFRVEELSKNRRILKNMAEVCRKNIEEKHDRREYLKYLLDI